jgi:hypothetical protein
MPFYGFFEKKKKKTFLFKMSNFINYDQIKKAAANHPKPPNIKYTYGTAGFRMKYDFYLNHSNLIMSL